MNLYNISEPSQSKSGNHKWRDGTHIVVLLEQHAPLAYNIINSTVDGISAALTVVMNNSSSLATSSANGDAGNAITTSQTGDGDVNGQTVNLNITGGGSTYDITQSGIYDNNVTATFDGDSQDVDITQSD